MPPRGAGLQRDAGALRPRRAGAAGPGASWPIYNEEFALPGSTRARARASSAACARTALRAPSRRGGRATPRWKRSRTGIRYDRGAKPTPRQNAVPAIPSREDFGAVAAAGAGASERRVPRVHLPPLRHRGAGAARSCAPARPTPARVAPMPGCRARRGVSGRRQPAAAAGRSLDRGRRTAVVEAMRNVVGVGGHAAGDHRLPELRQPRGSRVAMGASSRPCAASATPPRRLGRLWRRRTCRCRSSRATSASTTSRRPAGRCRRRRSSPAWACIDDVSRAVTQHCAPRRRSLCLVGDRRRGRSAARSTTPCAAAAGGRACRGGLRRGASPISASSSRSRAASPLAVHDISDGGLAARLRDARDAASGADARRRRSRRISHLPARRGPLQRVGRIRSRGAPRERLRAGARGCPRQGAPGGRSASRERTTRRRIRAGDQDAVRAVAVRHGMRVWRGARARTGAAAAARGREALDRPRVAVVQFPGVNCEDESARALEAVPGSRPRCSAGPDLPPALARFDGFLLPGGFTYQDRVRAGAVAAKDPLLDGAFAEAERGKPVLGICNGAQVLVEAGLVPGVGRGRSSLALAPNRCRVAGVTMRAGST